MRRGPADEQAEASERSSGQPHSPVNSGVVALQRSAGNRAVQGLMASTGLVIQRKEVGGIVDALTAVMPEGPLKKAQIIGGLQKLDAEDRDDVNFSRALVDFVKERNGSDFDITDLPEAPNAGFGKKHLNAKWTFRHYTETKHDTLKSLAQLEGEGVPASKNTNDRDWEQLGNQGYVFGLVSIDGEVPDRTWLKNMKYYAEYDLDALSSVWVSGDMLTDEGRKSNSYQGSGTIVKAQLAKMLGFVGEGRAKALDAKFKGVLEAKVPSGTLDKPEWKTV